MIKGRILEVGGTVVERGKPPEKAAADRNVRPTFSNRGRAPANPMVERGKPPEKAAADRNVRPTIGEYRKRCSKWRFLACVPLMAALSAVAQPVVVQSSRILLSFDSQGRKRIEWRGAGEHRNIVGFHPAVQEGVIVSGTACTAFVLDRNRTAERRVTDPEFGPSLEAVVTGLVDDREHGIKIEKTTRVLLPDAFPDAAIFETGYRNAGNRTLHLDRVYSQRVLADRSLAEPVAKPYDFASFQGGAYKWGTEYALMRLQPGFKQSNFQGLDDVNGPEGNGGGMPFIDVWSPAMGVALGHLEKTPKWLSLPVEVTPDGGVELAITESPLAKLGQKEWLGAGDTYRTVTTAVIFHKLDSFDALRTYGQLLRRRGVAIRDSSSDYAYEPYWKSWGWIQNFTVKNVLDALPELKSMDIRVANIDMGWYDYMGDWQVNRAAGKFPEGDSGLIGLVGKLHAEGFKTSFWWYPFGVDEKSRLAREHKDLLVRDERGEYPRDANNFYQLCPAYEPALAHVREVLAKAISVWGFDGVYSDYQGQSGVPPCFNPAHHHQSPLDSFESVPKMFEMIDSTLRRLKPGSLHEVCICSMPHSPYNMPFYDLANASDPVSASQARGRIKIEKAIRGGNFAVGDCYQVPIEEWTGYSIPESFESGIGTGAQITTFYRELNGRQRDLWTRWFREYRELGLSRAEYLNLYDLVFDKPEIHVVRKGADLYYGVFADVWPRDKYKIELRGLDPLKTYRVYDYGNRRDLGLVEGSKPLLNIGFKDNLLLRVRACVEKQSCY